jgi:hypothetical protein
LPKNEKKRKNISFQVAAIEKFSNLTKILSNISIDIQKTLFSSISAGDCVK